MVPDTIKTSLIPNIFDPSDYFELDVRNGVLKSCYGVKFCTLSSPFLRGLHKALEYEAGPAWRSILRSCGKRWGERFANRFLNEIQLAYSEDLNTMAAGRFDGLVREFFAICGWGRLSISYEYLPSGIVEVEVAQPILAEILPIKESRCDVLLEGVLGALFSKVTGQELKCIETQTTALGAPSSMFIIGLDKRLEIADSMVEASKSHQEIMETLLGTTCEV